MPSASMDDQWLVPRPQVAHAGNGSMQLEVPTTLGFAHVLKHPAFLQNPTWAGHQGLYLWIFGSAFELEIRKNLAEPY